MSGHTLCDFKNTGDRRVHLSAHTSAPFARLTLGSASKTMVTLELDEARILRDGLNRFIAAATALAPHADAYATLLASQGESDDLRAEP